MLKKKIKILTKYKTALPLMNAVRVKALLPYEDGRILEKTTVNIVDAENGIVELLVSDFEVQGLKAGVSSFSLKVYMDDGTMFIITCVNGMKIRMDEKSQRKVWDGKENSI